jgi:serine phosphatase RsbU (regulator of sigma subunit)
MCWDGLTSDCCEPAKLLGGIHSLLQGSLPEGVYVEATLARLRPDGQVVVAPAGGTRILLRSDRAAFALHTLRGAWLGLTPPDSEDQRTWFLSSRDELVLGSDGLFDQIGNLGGVDESRDNLFPDDAEAASLFDAVHQVLQEALRLQPQIDDITMIMVRKADKTAGGNGAP